MNSFFINKLKPDEISTIAYFTGLICLILGVFLLLPSVFAFIFHDNIKYVSSFLLSALLSFITGIILHTFVGKNKLTELSLKGSLIFVFTIWGVAALFSALPYFFSGDLGFLDSLFQSMSGITTTGFSLLTVQNFSISFWEVFTNWFGGLGIIILIIVIIPTSSNLKRLYFAEGRTEQMTPNVKHTATIFIKLYLILTVTGIVSYLLLGLKPFEAVCYAMSAIATGGFSPYPASVGYFNSLPVQAVTIVLMILGSTNFILLYRVLKGNFKACYKDIENKTMISVITLGTILITLCLFSNHIYRSDIPVTLSHSLFQVVSIISTTGFTSTDVNMWPPFCWHIMILLMLCGGGICSTASGIKLYNVYVLFKTLWWEGQTLFQPKNSVIVKKIHHDGRTIELTNREIKPILIYILVYLMIFIVSATVILIYTGNIQTAYTIAASSLGNIGIGPGYVNIGMPAIVKIVMIIEFWIGRTGVWPILLLIVYEINKFAEITGR